jgi:hypothetical protein
VQAQQQSTNAPKAVTRMNARPSERSSRANCKKQMRSRYQGHVQAQLQEASSVFYRYRLLAQQPRKLRPADDEDQSMWSCAGAAAGGERAQRDGEVSAVILGVEAGRKRISCCKQATGADAYR